MKANMDIHYEGSKKLLLIWWNINHKIDPVGQKQVEPGRLQITGLAPNCDYIFECYETEDGINPENFLLSFRFKASKDVEYLGLNL